MKGYEMIVEIDGEVHDEKKDKERDAWFMGMGYPVTRIKNYEVDRMMKNA